MAKAVTTSKGGVRNEYGLKVNLNLNLSIMGRKTKKKDATVCGTGLAFKLLLFRVAAVKRERLGLGHVLDNVLNDKPVVKARVAGVHLCMVVAAEASDLDFLP